MIVKLPIVDKGLSEVEVHKMTGGIIADAQKIAVSGNPYKAMQVFTAGCIDSLNGITGKAEKINSLDSMPYKNIEELMVRIIGLESDKDAIEGVYECPLCHTPKKCVGDNADHMSDLEVIYSDSNDPIVITLESDIETKEEDQGLVKIIGFEMHNPTLGDCIRAYDRVGLKDSIRTTYQIWINAIDKVNGQEVDDKFKKRWGMYIMEKLSRAEFTDIANKTTAYGLVNEIEKECNNCEKVWKVQVNTAGFFASALQ